MTDTQNTTAARPLRFGTLGWRNPGWADAYYPEDLPEDWQLGFYANELTALLLPAASWAGRPPAELGAWAQETHDAFRWYLQGDPAYDEDAQRTLASVLGERLGGLLWPQAPAPEGWLAPLEDMPERINAWGDDTGLRLALLHVDGMDLRAQRHLLDTLKPWLDADRPAALIVTGDDVTPATARELQTVAELMGLA